MVIGTSQHRSEGSHGSVPFKSPNSVKGRMLSTFLQWRYKEITWQSQITWLVSVSLLDSNPRLKFSLNIYNMHSKVIPSKPKKDRRAWFRPFPGQETEIHDVKQNLQVRVRVFPGPPVCPQLLRDSSLRLGTTLEIHFGCPVIRSYQSLQLKQQLSHGILQTLPEPEKGKGVGERFRKRRWPVPIQT